MCSVVASVNVGNLRLSNARGSIRDLISTGLVAQEDHTFEVGGS
jgi:hypothetical protein